MHPARYGFQQKPISPMLAWGHPLTRGLVGAWLYTEGAGGTVYDRSGHKNHGSISGATWEAMGLRHDAAQEKISVFDPDIVSQAEGSFFCRFIQRGAWPAYGMLLNVDSSSNGSSHELAFLKDASNHLAFFPNFDQDSGDNWDFGDTPANVLTTGATHTIVVTWKNGDTIAGYLDGVPKGALEGDGSWTASAWTQSEFVAIGSGTGSGGLGDGYANVTVIMAAIYDRAMISGEVEALYENPYGMFHDSSQRRRYFDQGATGTIELTAGVLTVPSPGAVDATMLMPPKTIYIDDTDASAGSENPNGIIDLTPMMTALCSKLDANITKLHWIVSAPNDSDFSETPSLEATDTLDTPLTSNPQRSENYEYGD